MELGPKKVHAGAVADGAPTYLHVGRDRVGVQPLVADGSRVEVDADGRGVEVVEAGCVDVEVVIVVGGIAAGGGEPQVEVVRTKHLAPN